MLFHQMNQLGLVGDAGHFKDPTPGQGISDAFRQADQLAQATEDGLGTTSPDAAMQRWWRWRDDDAYEMYWFAQNMGAPGVSPPLNPHLLLDIARDPDTTQLLFRVINHEVRPSQLITTSRAARAASSFQARTMGRSTTQRHVRMLGISFGPWQPTTASSQGDV